MPFLSNAEKALRRYDAMRSGSFSTVAVMAPLVIQVDDLRMESSPLRARLAILTNNWVHGSQSALARP